jgi:hypothetical protein
MFTGNVVVKLLYDPLQVLLNCPALSTNYITASFIFCQPAGGIREGFREKGKAKRGRTGKG